MPFPKDDLLYFIRPVAGETPRTKTAAVELMTAAPQQCFFICNLAPTDDKKMIYLCDMQPGQCIRYTDGEGKYYGTVTRSRLDNDTGEPSFIFDAKGK